MSLCTPNDNLFTFHIEKQYENLSKLWRHEKIKINPSTQYGSFFANQDTLDWSIIFLQLDPTQLMRCTRNFNA